MITINEIYTDLINKFPADIDPNRVFKDVTVETKPLVDEYYRLYNANDLDGASLLIQNNPVLQDMIINAYVIQYLYDMNISTQRFYMNDVQQYLVNIVAYKNDFDLSQKYTKYNVVSHMVDGAKEAFMCVDKNTPIGTLPTNTTYWVSLTLRGEQGASGTGLAWRGTYNSTINYHKDDCVAYNNILWAAKRDTFNRVPQDISDDWEYALKLDLKAEDIICNDGNTVEKKLTDINSTKADLTYLDTKLTEQQTYTDRTRTYTLTHNRAEATTIKGVTSDVGVGEKSPDNPYCITGVETNGVTLYSLPDGISDEYNAQTGVLTKRVEEIVLNGSEVFIWADKPSSDKTETGFTIQFVKNGKTTNLNLCASNLVPSSSENITGMRIITNQGAYFHKIPYNWIGILGTDTVEVAKQKIKQWLSKNPVTVLYELETPETIQLTPKTTYQHTLSDLPTGQGIYQCQFIAQADYTEGDTFTGYTAKPTGEETILPDKAFVKGDIVSVLVDTVNKKLGFKIGGSGVNQTLPPQVTGFAVTSGNAENKLSWLLPVDTSAYEGLLIVRKVGSAPTKLSDGTKINISKTATSYTDTELTNDTKYYYRAFPYNFKKQYQTDIVGAVVSGTPKAIPPIFGEATWEQINLASTTNAIPSTWHVGDTKDITLTTGETLTMQIYDFNHDDLADGSGKAGITLGMKNLMVKTRQMNANNTTVFLNSEMYNWLQGELLNSLPSDLKSVLKLVNKKTAVDSLTTTIETNSMKIFLFSEEEVYGALTWSAPGQGTQYDYFLSPINRIKYLSNGVGDPEVWWGRSPMSKKTYGFCVVQENGTAGAFEARQPKGICFGFCI